MFHRATFVFIGIAIIVITVAVVDSIQSFLCVAAFSVHVDGVGPSPSSTSSSTSSSSSPPSITFTLPQKPKMMKTFYRRTLPSTAISFSSREGKAIFASAMASGGTNSFFSLIEQLQTQPEPSYCGLTTLVIVLNALAVDPRRSWKGPWRWYEESMLNCCVDLEQVKQTGITFGTFACLAKCQGLNVHAVHATNSTVDEFRRIVKQTCTESMPSASSGVRNGHQAHPNQRPTSFLIVSYTRQVIGQTGTGHFSPIGAYDETSDHVLVLDTARFKYGPHWIPLQLMFDALLPIDKDTGKSRGYAVLSYDEVDEISNAAEGKAMTSHLPLSILFVSKRSKDYIRSEYKNFLRHETMGDDTKLVTLQLVVSFWTKNYADINYVWELVEPQLIPVDSADIEMVGSLRRLLKSFIEEHDESSSIIPANMLLSAKESGAFPGMCCSTAATHTNNALEISPGEALYVAYLASLPEEVRREVVNSKIKAITTDDEAKLMEVGEQLLAEAALISFALEACDSEFCSI